MGKKLTRRTFIKAGGAIGINTFLGKPLIPELAAASEKIDLVIVRGKDHLNNTKQAVAILGGISRYVPRGTKVALLPNPSFSNPGSYTRPAIVRAAIQLCKEAGAAEIACIGWLSMGDWIRCGIKKIIDQEGADLVITDLRDESGFEAVPVRAGIGIREVRIIKSLAGYDVLINLPITKRHSGNFYSGAMKNLMGLNSPVSCQQFHRSKGIFGSDDIEFLEQCIADLNTVVHPDLCIVDATEFLITNGPQGPGRLSRPHKVIAGVDPVAIDAYCATLFDLDPAENRAVKCAYDHGLGEMDLNKLNIVEIEA